MHVRFNFDACPVHSPLGFVHLMQQNLSASALFCHNSLEKVNMQLLIYEYLQIDYIYGFSFTFGLLHNIKVQKWSGFHHKT